MIIEIGNDTFGRNLYKIRSHSHMSRKVLSKQIGVSVYSIAGWEKGTVAARLEEKTFLRLCDVFHVTPEELTDPDTTEF